MKLYVLCALLIAFAIGVKAQHNITQTITGKVYRLGTDSAIVGASVYYSGSTIGTTTDSKGNFTLKAKPQQIPVIVSCIGYYSATVTYEAGKSLIVYLKPKLTELQAVTIRADDMKRSDEVALFTKEFLGTSAFALSCTIANIDDVNLFYNTKTKTLTADCDKAIIIKNKKLGYTISYYLDKFIDTPTELTFSGNYIFTENTELADQDKIKHNREDAYKGSRMQLVRALCNHTINKTDFYLFNKYGFAINEDHIIKDSLQQKYVSWKDKILINYHGSVTTLTPLEAASFIDKNGFYSSSLKWAGYLSHQRIGDLLPFEYQPEKDVKKPAEIASLTVSLPIDKPVNKPDNQLVFEKTYLHTDRDVYAQGDTLWFKAYLVNALDNKLTTSSGTLYVDLISPDAKIISSELIRLDNGLGDGDFDLPDSLAAGKYRLRAYTNWMRNFGDNFIFEKEITIVSSSNEVAGKKVTAKEVAVAGKNNNKTPTATTAIKSTATTLPIIRFYPESGSLVEGIGSLIAVKADDSFGHGIAASGLILNNTGDTITRFTCNSLGMGLFALLPVKGQAYHALVRFGANSHEAAFDLPSALNKGLALQVKQTDTLIRAVVSSSINYTSLATKPNYTLTVKHAGTILLSQQLSLTNNQTSVKIPTAKLPEGIAAITLYDETGKPNCERLVYIHPSKTERVNITTDKQTYQPKEKVTVNISALANSNLSMAVVDAGIVPEQADDIVSYLRLQSEVRGSIEHARRYFDTTNTNRFKQLDLLLMTQGWRDFVWRRLADTAIRISYATENGVNISGKLRDEVSNKWLSGLNISLYANGAKGDKIFTEKTDVLGRFNFQGLILYGIQNIKLAAVNARGDKKGSLWIDTLLRMPVKPVTNRIAVSQTTKDSIAVTLKKSRTDNIKNIGVTKLKEVKINDKKNINLNDGGIHMSWGPDKTQTFDITPKDYEYRTLEWFLLQKARGAMISTSPEITGVVFEAETSSIRSVPSPSGEMLVSHTAKALVPPILFINGWQLSMEDKTQAEAYRILYFKLLIQKFKKIVVTELIGGGRIVFLTLNEDALIDNPGSLSIDVPGYYQARIFYQPPPNAKPQLADYRTTIHWEPNIKTDATGKATVSFYNAVPQTDVRVVVQGVTEKGVPVVAAVNYTIK